MAEETQIGDNGGFFKWRHQIIGYYRCNPHLRDSNALFRGGVRLDSLNAFLWNIGKLFF